MWTGEHRAGRRIARACHVRALRSSTAKAPKRRKRGGLDRSADPQGYDTGKKVTGPKRHIMVDTLGLMLGIVVHPANVHDRDGAAELLRRTRRLFPFIEVI